MSFYATPSTPCRKPVWMDTPSETSPSPLLRPLFLSFLLLPPSSYSSSCVSSLSSLLWICQPHQAATSKSFFPLHTHRLDRQTQATTLVHQIFGGYLRSRGIYAEDTEKQKGLGCYLAAVSALLCRLVAWGLPTVDRKCNKGSCLTLQSSVSILLAETSTGI